jgi:hypothetical protein
MIRMIIMMMMMIMMMMKMFFVIIIGRALFVKMGASCGIQPLFVGSYI